MKSTYKFALLFATVICAAMIPYYLREDTATNPPAGISIPDQPAPESNALAPVAPESPESAPSTRKPTPSPATEDSTIEDAPVLAFLPPALPNSLLPSNTHDDQIVAPKIDPPASPLPPAPVDQVFDEPVVQTTTKESPKAAQDKPVTGDKTDEAQEQPAKPADQKVTRATALAAGKGADSPPTPSTYKIQKGDTFVSIAQAHLGSGSQWQRISNFNPTVDPLKLRIGQIIRLPAPARFRHADLPEANEPKPAPGQLIHTVEAGETLSTIAEHYFGDPAMWRKIYQANSNRIGPNPDRIMEGTDLQILLAGQSP